ncbi:CD99 antigen-like protein 2 isoform X4 [Caretta caretta]|uniref:CD99 antigen-like protein 2 isoform X4 n=1 Tax=Caretta caretta TaxID=8467 RepID=UPI0020946056|nr:CD99 antigen-like protein 2 isoform X6 [Caretta caretta]
MAGRSLLLLAAALAALLGRGYGDDFDDFSLADALDDSPTKRPPPTLPKKPSGRTGYGDGLDDFSLSDALDDLPTKRPPPKLPKKPSGRTGDFDLSDYFDTPLETTTKPGKATTKPYPKKPDDISLWDVIHTTTTKKPKTTKAPPKKNPAKDPADFDLSDALDDQNDGKGGGKPNVKPGEAFSDDDLAGVLDDGEYRPDKKKGGSDYDAEGLNAEYVKGENTEAVVTEEPQVKYSALETQSAEPLPPQDNAKV